MFALFVAIFAVIIFTVLFAFFLFIMFACVFIGWKEINSTPISEIWQRLKKWWYMADELGLSAGAKGISEGLKTGREAGREIGKNIEDVQKEAVDVAKERANAKIRERREAELRKERAIFKALEEYKHRKKITDEEYKLRIDFIKQYGTKEWQKLIDIKTEIERLEKEDKKYFDAELSKVKWVQFWCFMAAGWIAYYIVWGSKKWQKNQTMRYPKYWLMLIHHLSYLL